MEIQQLRHLIATAECGSFAQAAHQCGTSRQNIAHSIKVLGSELGVVLFERSGGGMAPTVAGVRVVEKAREVVEKVDSLQTLLQGGDGMAELGSLAVSTNLFATLTPSLSELFTRYAETKQILEMSLKECYDAVCAQEADAAVVMCMKRDFPRCDAYELAGSQAFGLVSERSSLAGKEAIEVRDLLDRRLVIMSSPDVQYRPLFVQLDALGFDRANVNIIPSTSTMLTLVRGRDAVSFVSGSFAAKPPSGTVAVPLADPDCSWHFFILYRMNARNSHALMDFASEVRQAFAQDMGESLPRPVAAPVC